MLKTKTVNMVVLELTEEEANILKRLIGNHALHDIIDHGLSRSDVIILQQMYNILEG